MGLDGVDIDYEYYYDDGQKGSSFDKGSEARYFLKQVTVGLRESLKPDAIIIHVPMDSDMVPSSGYLQLLAEPDMRSAIDFLLPQYYNGKTAFPQSHSLKHIYLFTNPVKLCDL